MSMTQLEEQKNKFLEELEELQEVCDTLEKCTLDDSCKTCETNKKVEDLEVKIEELEVKIEKLIQAEEEE